jgi:hypothetical protein
VILRKQIRKVFNFANYSELVTSSNCMRERWQFLRKRQSPTSREVGLAMMKGWCPTATMGLTVYNPSR